MISSWHVLASLLLIGAVPQDEVPSEIKIKVTARRPVLAAVEELRQRHGWRVTYEDDAMSGMSEAEPYTLGFVYSTQKQVVDPLSVLTRLVDAHALLGRGRYKVEQSGFGWHVSPQFGSVLDAKISLRTQAVSPKDVAEAVCAAVRQGSGKKVVAGRAKPIQSKTVRVLGENEQARKVLSRALGGFGVPLVWDLLYSDELDGYVLVVNQLYTVSGTESRARTVK